MRSVGAYDAKTHLPRLLDEVAAGDSITITKHGVPVAVLVPVHPRPGPTVAEAIVELRAIRTRSPLDGLTLRELIDDGRR